MVCIQQCRCFERLGAGATCRAAGSGSPQQKHAQQKLCNSALYNPKHNGCGGIVSSGHVSWATHWERDFRPEGDHKHPSVLSSLCSSLPEGAGCVGSKKSPAKQVCSQVSPPFSVTPNSCSSYLSEQLMVWLCYNELWPWAGQLWWVDPWQKCANSL